MNILGFARGLTSIRAVIQELRDHDIQVTGPYRRRNGDLMYSLAGCVVTEKELQDLSKAGKLNAAGVYEFTTALMKTTARLHVPISCESQCDDRI